MFNELNQMVTAFEQGRLTRRQLVGGLTALCAAGLGLNRSATALEKQDSTFDGRGLNHIALRVTDVPRSRDWYQKHLGLSVLRDGVRNCFMRSGEHFVALFQSDKAGLDHYCYTIDKYRPPEVVETLRTAGLQPRREENRVYFDDPDGITVQLAGPNDWSDWS